MFITKEQLTSFMHFTSSTDTLLADKIRPGVRAAYYALGLTGEAAEFAEASNAQDPKARRLEGGDPIWYWSRLTVTCLAATTNRDKTLEAFVDRYLGPFWDLIGNDKKNAHVTSQQEDEEGYALLKASGQVGESAKRILRDDSSKITSDRAHELLELLGEWFMEWAVMVSDTVQHPDRVLDDNRRKLMSRKHRGKIHGSGDNR